MYLGRPENKTCICSHSAYDHNFKGCIECSCIIPWDKVGNTPEIRAFATGATRDSDNGKLDYEAFINPLVLKRYAEFMHRHRIQSDGSVRDGDNWQKGIPLDAYAKSLNRHHMDFWLHHRGYTDEAVDPDIEEVLCAIMFNSMGYLKEILEKRKNAKG